MSAFGEPNNLDDDRVLRRLWGKTTAEVTVFHPALYYAPNALRDQEHPHKVRTSLQPATDNDTHAVHLQGLENFKSIPQPSPLVDKVTSIVIYMLLIFWMAGCTMFVCPIIVPNASATGVGVEN